MEVKAACFSGWTDGLHSIREMRIVWKDTLVKEYKAVAPNCNKRFSLNSF